MRKGRFWGLIIAVTLVITTLLAGAAPTMAAKPGGNQAELNSALVSAADRHLSLQGTYSGIPNTWEWTIGSNAGYWNVVGISATGLLAAYERTGDADYLNGAIATGNTLVTRYDAQPNDWNGRPYAQDIEFLVRLTDDSGNPLYKNKAVVYYARITNEKTAAQNADRYIDVRKSLAGWDLASQIRAAASVGNVDYATGMIARLIERRAAWENVSYGGWNYTTSSYASLVWAFRDLGNNSAYAVGVKEALMKAQGIDGSWDGGDYQTTAYAVMGLAKPRTPVSSQAVDKAWVFLRDSQSSTGGWSYPPEYGEINSEVIMALGAVRLDEGKKLGHTDPNPAKGKDTGKHPLDPAP